MRDAPASPKRGALVCCGCLGWHITRFTNLRHSSPSIIILSTVQPAAAFHTPRLFASLTAVWSTTFKFGPDYSQQPPKKCTTAPPVIDAKTFPFWSRRRISIAAPSGLPSQLPCPEPDSYYHDAGVRFTRPDPGFSFLIAHSVDFMPPAIIAVASCVPCDSLLHCRNLIDTPPRPVLAPLLRTQSSRPGSAVGLFRVESSPIGATIITIIIILIIRIT